MIVTKPVRGANREYAEGSFAHDLNNAVVRLQAELLDILHAMQDSCTNSCQMATHLKMSRRTAWKFWRLAHEGNVADAIQFLPGNKAFEIFLRAARTRGGVPESNERGVRRALAQLNEVQNDHAGNRESLHVLASGVNTHGRAGTDIRYRRQAFVGQSAILGRQSLTSYHLSVQSISEDHRVWELGSIHGAVQHRRTRTGTLLHIMRSPSEEFMEYPGMPGCRWKSRLIGTTAQSEPFAAEFTSSGVPKVHKETMADGKVSFYLGNGPTGNRSIHDSFIARTIKIEDPNRLFINEPMDIRTQVITPTQRIVLDLFVQRNMCARTVPAAYVYENPSETLVESPERQLPITCEVLRVGSGVHAARTPYVQGSQRMAHMLANAIGVTLDEFVLFRAIIEYPPIYSFVVLRVPITTDHAPGAR